MVCVLVANWILGSARFKFGDGPAAVLACLLGGMIYSVSLDVSTAAAVGVTTLAYMR